MLNSFNLVSSSSGSQPDTSFTTESPSTGPCQSSKKHRSHPFPKARPSRENLTVLTDLGCHFFAEAQIPDANLILVDLGLGFHVYLTLDETRRLQSFTFQGCIRQPGLCPHTSG